MGIYLNPGNIGFTVNRKGGYIDKTGLIGLVNNTIDTNKKLTCISRPRRFGKSYAAQMLCAYYGKGCDSHGLFNDLEIAKDSSYEAHLNKYDVIYLDMTAIKPYTNEYADIVPFIMNSVSQEIVKEYLTISENGNFIETLVGLTEISGNKIIMIIDEWDAPIRENPSIEKPYLEFLRSLFKSSATTSKVFAAAYMTGILPIKKDGSQSAISDFYEYSMIKPRQFGKYVGFTEDEVCELCKSKNIDITEMKAWYDGYWLKDVGSVYNPNSVIKAVDNNDFDSYWTETSASESLMNYISQDYNGLAKTVAELIGGMEVRVDTVGFANDLTTFRGKDDVLTLLIHLGYLSYNSDNRTARIPNEEIRLEFQRSIHTIQHSETRKRLEECERLFLDTINKNEEAVAAQIEKIHEEETSPLHYNKEDNLRSVIKLAYYTYKDHYLQWEELPAGSGYADVVYIPKKDSGWPALVIELKWDNTAESAIEQILGKKYPDALKGLECPVLLVGISYDKEAASGKRKHHCRITEI